MENEILALVQAYLAAVALSEDVQSQIWKSSGLTLGQMRGLRKLHGEPHSLGELATLLALPPASVTRLVDRLEERGLVERRRDDPDRRRVVAALKRKGEEIVTPVPLLRGTPVADAAERLSAEERRRITAAFKAFVDAALLPEPVAR